MREKRSQASDGKSDARQESGKASEGGVNACEGRRIEPSCRDVEYLTDSMESESEDVDSDAR